MKRSAIARIIIWSLTAILLTGILIAGIAAPSFLNLLSFSTGRSGNYTYGSATVSAAQIDEVEIEWVSGDITITEDNNDQISFTETSNRDLKGDEQLGYRIEGRKLVIVQTTKSYWFGSAPSKDLQLTLPPMLYALTLEAVSADVTMTGSFTIHEVDMETVSGRLDVNELSCNELSMESVSGRMDLTVGKTAPKQIDVSAVSANVTIYWPESEGFTAEMEAVSGNTYSEFSTLSHGDSIVYGNGACEIDYESVSGDLNILKK